MPTQEKHKQNITPALLLPMRGSKRKYSTTQTDFSLFAFHFDIQHRSLTKSLSTPIQNKIQQHTESGTKERRTVTNQEAAGKLQVRTPRHQLLLT